MTRQTKVLWLAAAAAALGAVVAQAQVGKATQDELNRRGGGPGPVAGSASSGPPGANQAITVAANTDPKDFSGAWRQNMGGGGGGPGGGGGGGGGGGPGGGGGGGAPGGAAGGAPGGAGGPGGGGGPGGAGGPGGGAPQERTVNGISDKVLCLPQSGTTVGVDGPLLLVQTPEQITWAAEEMHTIRRIFLKGGFTPNFKPDYLGEAIGHWDGNTLVVETQGLKSQAAGAKMVERWTKAADGKSIEMKVKYVDASGKAIGGERTTTLTWAGGQQVMEWICEDYNDEWLPGGAEYNGGKQ
ncbi:MAG: hypothetical protein QM718_07375 [Steroidobacteraceae bacterium]